jgi:serine/threonine protein kinase
MTLVSKKMPEVDDQKFADELVPGTTLSHGQYVIEKFLNSGGFGITYLARDSLKRLIVIKECFPSSFCRRSNTIVGARSRAHQAEFRSIVKLFMQEAFSLAKLKHPHIVGVHQVFEDNDTAYMAMDFVEGYDLQETLGEGVEPLTASQITLILDKLLGAVGFIHQQDVLHRDISPDNILIDKKSGDPVLIDFGAAREEVSKASRALSEMRVVKDGYSPQEFYINGSVQGPSSDLYALAATFYHLITKNPPPNAQVRLSAIASKEPDPYVAIRGKVPGYSEAFLAAIDKAMNLFPKDRIQSADEWIAMIDQKSTAKLPPVPRVKSRLVSALLSSKSPSAGTAAKPKARGVLLGSCAALIVVMFGYVAIQTDAFGSSAEPEAKPTVVATAPQFQPESPSVVASDEQVVVALPIDTQVAPVETTQTASEPVEVVATTDAVPATPAIEPAEETTIVAMAEPAPIPFNAARVEAMLAQYHTVKLPFVGTPEANNVIAALAVTAPDWMQPGQRITEVNGVAIQAADDIGKVISETKDLAGSTEAEITFEIEAFAGADRIKRDHRLPVVQVISLTNGVSFEISNTADGYVATVTATPDDTSDSGLKVGDTLLANMADTALFSAENTLADVLTREIGREAETLSVAVQRDGARFVASFSLTPTS